MRTGASWPRVSALLDEVLDLPEGQRRAHLYRACAGSEALRAEVERLLQADAGQGGPLDRRWGESWPTLAAEESQKAAWRHDMIGRQVGAYRIIEELGRGGMGAVFLAEHADGHFQQRVALKVIKPDMDSAAVRQRFLAERLILARLDHPLIARLLDGGVTDDGLPFFVVEHVEGAALLAHCRQEGLSLETRLRLFVDVCEAVHHAHRNRIVHRDLKPSNILVTQEGHIKLLDFGIAKVLDAEDEIGDLTQTGERPMTPGYAAPEQIRGDPVTTAADIYALGVVLCELVGGERPRQGKLPKIRERGLRSILLVALQQEPQRRYPSAEALGGEVQRYLAGLSLQVGGETLASRARRFARRYLWGVGAAGVALLSLLARRRRHRQSTSSRSTGTDPDPTPGRQEGAQQSLDRKRTPHHTAARLQRFEGRPRPVTR